MKDVGPVDIEAMIADRFRGGVRRSDAYKEGFRVALERHNTPRNQRKSLEKEIPYRPGTAEWDAWFHGHDHAQDCIRASGHRFPLTQEKSNGSD